SRGRSRPSPPSGVLQRHGLQHVRDVFALVEGLLEVVVDLLPLDDLERVALLLEQLAQRLMVDRVSLFLELLGLAAAPLPVVALLEAAHAFGEIRRASGRESVWTC